MLVLERDGSLAPDIIDICVISGDHGIVDLPSDVALHHATIIDQLIEMMFTVMGLSSFELRVHESDPDDMG